MEYFDYLIIGNSAAAISAIEAIRETDEKSTMAVVSPEDFPAYSTPLISYLLKGKVCEEGMPIRDEAFYERNRVSTRFGQAATALDAGKHTVRAGDDDFGYGKLLVACGSRPLPAPLEGLEGENVLPLLNLTDARAIEACIEKAREMHPDEPIRAVVIGSGLIGCKACEGLTSLADEVCMLARSPQILRSILDEDASRIAERALLDNGVDVMLSTVATSFEKEGERITALHLSDGQTIACDLVVLASGIVANAGMVEKAGARVARGIVCDKRMKTSLEDVWAAGDVACSHNVLDGSDKVIALWPNAVVQGRVAGHAMAGVKDVFEDTFPFNSISLFGMTMQTAGIVVAGKGMEAEVVLDGDTYTKFVREKGHLLGFILVNRPDCAGIYTRMIRERISLLSVDGGAFRRAPMMKDLPARQRWDSMHEGYPGRREF